MDTVVEQYKPQDGEAVWKIIREVIKSGDTYAFDPNSTREDMLAYWLGEDKHCYVARHKGHVAGTFIIKQNQPGLGAHVANASYMVHPDYRGYGIGRTMGEYSLCEARKLGFLSMQFNIVVKTNEGAVRLWKKLGFEIIGEVPEAFRHPQHGLVNAYIMYRKV